MVNKKADLPLTEEEVEELISELNIEILDKVKVAEESAPLLVNEFESRIERAADDLNSFLGEEEK